MELNVLCKTGKLENCGFVGHWVDNAGMLLGGSVAQRAQCYLQNWGKLLGTGVDNALLLGGAQCYLLFPAVTLYAIQPNRPCQPYALNTDAPTTW